MPKGPGKNKQSCYFLEQILKCTLTLQCSSLSLNNNMCTQLGACNTNSENWCKNEMPNFKECNTTVLTF